MHAWMNIVPEFELIQVRIRELYTVIHSARNGQRGVVCRLCGIIVYTQSE